MMGDENKLDLDEGLCFFFFSPFPRPYRLVVERKFLNSAENFNCKIPHTGELLFVIVIYSHVVLLIRLTCVWQKGKRDGVEGFPRHDVYFLDC